MRCILRRTVPNDPQFSKERKAMTVTELISTWEDQVLETVHQSQETVVKAVGIWAEAGGNLIPKPLPLSLPYSDQIPGTAELVENYFAYSAKLLDAQKAFVGAVLDAVEPVLAATSAPKR
jgi:hypothetical protein